MNIRHIRDSQLTDSGRVSFDKTRKTVVDANHFKVGISRLDSDGADDAIYSWGGTSTD